MRIVFYFSFKDPNLLLWQRWQKRGITAKGSHLMKILEMWRSCPLLMIISCLLWGRENSHLSLPANQPVSLEQAAECVHSWDRLIKWGRFLTISSGWGTLSSLSPSSTLELLKGTTVPVWCDLVLTLEGDLEGWAASFFFLWEIQKQQIPFCSKAESGNSLICSNGALLLCTCSLVLCCTTRTSECEQQIRPSNSRSLYCRTSDTHQQPWELLTQFNLLGHKNCGMLQWNGSLAFWEMQQYRTLRCKLQITQQNRIGYRENDRLEKAGK